ncbi:MAG: LacI family DNA-binding transcriptional regulator [Eubacterium sp.]|nr:LacI family DNA-binding transcriptional regulator [Eubacterium sp.]
MSIKQIAKMTGVSPATVSRVLNNPDYRCSSPEMRDKIWNAAMELHYVPNSAARSLRQGREKEETWYINILITRMDASRTDPFFTELLHIIESEIHRHVCILSKVWYIPVFSDDKKCSRINIRQSIAEMQKDVEGYNDGLIIIGKCNHEIIRECKRIYKGVISVNRNSTNYEIDEILCDGQKIASMATEYLISLGHKRIGYVGEIQNEARYEGFCKTLEKHEIELLPACIRECPQTEKDGFETMKRWFMNPSAPTAIYCANDITAIGMLKFLSIQKGKYMPPSIIASDGIEEAGICQPMLTTIELPKQEMGRFALNLLTDRLHGRHKGVVRMELEGRLAIRNSCYPYES